MNKEILIEKLESWTLDRAREFYNYVAIPLLVSDDPMKHETVKIWERAEEGLYVISGAGVRYYGNDGILQTLLRHSVDKTANDFELYNQLYDACQNQSQIRMARLIERSVVETSRGTRVFKNYQSPDDELGIPLCADLWFDTELTADEMITNYSNQRLWIYNTMRDLGFSYFPEIDPICRLKNSAGYYFYDIGQFHFTREEFVEEYQINVSAEYVSDSDPELLRRDKILSTTDLNCSITYWRDDCKVKVLETNLYADMLGMVIKWVTRSNSVYTKAVITWKDKIITFDINQLAIDLPPDQLAIDLPPDVPGSRMSLSDFFRGLMLSISK